MSKVKTLGLFALLLIPSGTNLYSHDDVPLGPDPHPVGKPEPPPDPPEESVDIDYGRCTVDYSKIDLGDGYTLGDLWEEVKKVFGEDVAHLLGVEHHDVFLDPPVVPAKFNLLDPGTWGKPAKNKYRVRGFYGPMLNVRGWWKQLKLWVEEDEVEFINGSMMDKVRKIFARNGVPVVLEM